MFLTRIIQETRFLIKKKKAGDNMADERRYFKVTGKADNYSLIFPITPFPKFSSSVDT